MLKIFWRILLLKQLSQIFHSYWRFMFYSKFSGSCREGLLEEGSNNKKRISLEDNNMEMLIQISYHN